MLLSHCSEGFEICEFVTKTARMNVTGCDIIPSRGRNRYLGISIFTYSYISYVSVGVFIYVVGDAPRRPAFFDL